MVFRCRLFPAGIDFTSPLCTNCRLLLLLLLPCRLSLVVNGSRLTDRSETNRPSDIRNYDHPFIVLLTIRSDPVRKHKIVVRVVYLLLPYALRTVKQEALRTFINILRNNSLLYSSVVHCYALFSLSWNV